MRTEGSDIDPDLEDTPRKKKLRRQLFKQQNKRKRQTNRVRVLGQKAKRNRNKVISLKEGIKKSTDNNLLSLEQSNVIANLPG